MPRLATILLFFCLAALTVWPRWAQLHDPVRFDEAANALYYADRGLLHAMFGSGGNENHTLNSVLVWASVRCLGWSEAVIRLPALAAGLAYPFVLLFLMRGFLDGAPVSPAGTGTRRASVPMPAAWLAAIGAAVSPWLVFYSVNSRGYLLMTVCSAVVVGQVVGFLTGDSARPWRQGMWAGCWSGIGALAVRSMLVVVAGLVLLCLGWLVWQCAAKRLQRALRAATSRSGGLQALGYIRVTGSCSQAIVSRASRHYVSIWRAASPWLHKVTGSCSQAMASRGPVARGLPRFLTGWLVVAGAIPACWHAPQCLRLGWRGLVGVAPDLRLPPMTAMASSCDSLVAAGQFVFAGMGWGLPAGVLALAALGVCVGPPGIRLAAWGGLAIVLTGLAAGAGAGLPVLSRQWLPLTACLLPVAAAGAARLLRPVPALWNVGATMLLATFYLAGSDQRAGPHGSTETGAMPAAQVLAAGLPEQPGFVGSLVDLPPLLPVGVAFYWHEQHPDAARHVLGYDLRFDPALLENARHLLLVLAPGDDASQRLRELAHREPRLNGRLTLPPSAKKTQLGPYWVFFIPIRPPM